MKSKILMVGVGGQGTVLSSDIVCDVALLEGYDVKKSEIHGMAQRGGSVVSHVIFGEKVYSPVISSGGADILLSFENMEFLRYLEYVNKNTVLLLNTNKILPPSVASGEEDYPNDIINNLKNNFKEKYELDANKIAIECGNIKVSGMVMLGKLSTLLPFKVESWEKVIKERVPPKTIEMNIKALKLGREI
jgi:indolepyruvate ferredoxin oxidoreductase beta subunit